MIVVVVPPWRAMTLHGNGIVPLLRPLHRRIPPSRSERHRGRRRGTGRAGSGIGGRSALHLHPGVERAHGRRDRGMRTIGMRIIDVGRGGIFHGVRSLQQTGRRRPRRRGLQLWGEFHPRRHRLDRKLHPRRRRSNRYRPHYWHRHNGNGRSKGTRLPERGGTAPIILHHPQRLVGVQYHRRRRRTRPAPCAGAGTPAVPPTIARHHVRHGGATTDGMMGRHHHATIVLLLPSLHQQRLYFKVGHHGRHLGRRVRVERRILGVRGGRRPDRREQRLMGLR
mmetsp:Transcript_19041/g.45736  ORF Transcript_19041/g.45736 Transcript_19041/m.45736 type:complete len:280 (+) Transcript_19041:894-1733(+)